MNEMNEIINIIKSRGETDILKSVEQKLVELGIEYEREMYGSGKKGWWKIHLTSATNYVYDDSCQIFTPKILYATECWKTLEQSAIDKIVEFGQGKLWRRLDKYGM